MLFINMPIKIEEKLNKRVHDVSKILGVDQKQVVERALLLYLESVKKSLDLNRELEAWDELSDEALHNMKL